MSVYYMLDCHLFVSLPQETEGAMAKLHNLFHDEDRTGYYGMLGLKGLQQRAVRDVVHARNDWEEFAPRAREWLGRALAPTPEDIEYASWFRPSAQQEGPKS